MANGKGYLTLRDAMIEGIPYSQIKNMESSGKIIKIDRGLFAYPGTENDDLFIIQHRYPKGIFSDISALSLLGLIDHKSENHYMTFPKGYNPSSIKSNDWHIEIKRVVSKIYNAGITEISTEFGNTVRVYDKERTLCDILRGDGISPYILNNAMKKYFRSDDVDVAKLKEYAELLHVGNKIKYYIEILS